MVNLLSCSWEILHACNYRCPYCFFIPSWRDHPEETNGKHLSCGADDWLAFWRRLHDLYGSFSVDIVGGEPFTYPGFIPLLERLGQWHTTTTLTNLSWDVDQALDRLDPKRVNFNPSFHPHFAQIGPFIEKALRLKSGGFELTVILVSYPPIFDELPNYIGAFNSAGIPSWVAPYQGVYEGKTYPAAFTREQKGWLYGTHTNEPHEGFDHGVKDLSPFGKLCASGHSYFRAYPDGTVHRCISAKDLEGSVPLGHIKDPDFRLSRTPTPCPAGHCYSPLEYRNLIKTP